MQALNIQADVSKITALNLQSVPSNQISDNSVSFVSLVSSEIDRASSAKSETVSQSLPSKENVCDSKSSVEQKNPENQSKAIADNKEVAANAKNIANDVKETAENETDISFKIAENNAEQSKNEKNIAISLQNNVKKSVRTDVSSEKTAKTDSKKDKKSVKNAIKNDKNPETNTQDASKLLAISEDNFSEVSVAKIEVREISEAVEEISDISVNEKSKTEGKNALSLQSEIPQSNVISEEGDAAIASAIENLGKEAEGDKEEHEDFSEKPTAQGEKSETVKKGAYLSVRDERTMVSTAEKTEQKVEAENAEIKAVSENTVEMTMAAASETTANITSSNNQAASAVASNYQAMLANQIQNNAPEFVKAGAIVLRDNNQGTINLILHPESLGNVKVSLQLTDKVIAGQIVVHSQEAYNAFRDSIDSLKQAFAQNGFDTANFNLAMGGDMMNGNGGNHEGRADAPFMANRAYGEYADSAESIDSFSKVYAQSADGVDIVA